MDYIHGLQQWRSTFVFYADQAAQWILVVIVLFVYMTFYGGSGTPKQYVPKSQRSYVSRVMHRLGATLETFVTWVWNVLGNHVYRMKPNGIGGRRVMILITDDALNSNAYLYFLSS
jgi:hypothetical protein